MKGGTITSWFQGFSLLNFNRRKGDRHGFKVVPVEENNPVHFFSMDLKLPSVLVEWTKHFMRLNRKPPITVEAGIRQGQQRRGGSSNICGSITVKQSLQFLFWCSWGRQMQCTLIQAFTVMENGKFPALYASSVDSGAQRELLVIFLPLPPSEISIAKPHLPTPRDLKLDPRKQNQHVLKDKITQKQKMEQDVSLKMNAKASQSKTSFDSPEKQGKIYHRRETEDMQMKQGQLLLMSSAIAAKALTWMPYCKCGTVTVLSWHGWVMDGGCTDMSFVTKGGRGRHGVPLSFVGPIKQQADSANLMPTGCPGPSK